MTTALWLVASASFAQAGADDDVEITIEADAPTPVPSTTAAPAATPEAVTTPPAPAPAAVDSDALAQRIAALEAQLAELNARATPPAVAVSAPVEPTEPAPTPAPTELVSGDVKLRLSGYVQVQYSHSQLSQDELLQGGTVLNLDRFVVRRGRLRLRGEWKQTRLDFEIDGSTTRGPSTSVRRASLSFFIPSDVEDAPSLLEITAGLTEIPLGIELQQGQDEILFLERTTGSLAFFPGPVDVGLKTHGGVGPFRYALFITGGTPLDDRAGGPSAIDPTSAPDIIGRVGAETDLTDTLEIAGGVGFLTGTGFIPGTQATKDRINWNDLNGDGAIQQELGELTPILGRAAEPSTTFKRWAFNADLQLGLETSLGWSRLYAEATIASNLDRGLFIADPKQNGADLRELAWYLAYTQEITDWSVAGLRYDYYSPNADFLTTQRGRSIPSDGSIRTLSPFLGARLPSVGRVVLQYDVIFDKLARDARGVPTDVANNQWTIRVQGGF